MAKQGKFDINSRPGKSNAPSKVRNDPHLQAAAERKWNRLKNAALDDEFPVDRDQEVRKSGADITRARKLEAGRAKMAAKPAPKRTDHPYLGSYRRKGA